MYKYTLPNGILVNADRLVDFVLVGSEFPQVYLDIKAGLLVEVPSSESLALWVKEIGKSERYVRLDKFSTKERQEIALEFVKIFLENELTVTQIRILTKIIKEKGWFDFETFLIEKTDGWINGWEQFKHDEAWEYVHDWLINNPFVSIAAALDIPDDCDCAICALMKEGRDDDIEALKKAFETEAVMQSVKEQLTAVPSLRGIIRPTQMADKVFVFKITLEGTKPVVWRRIAISADSTFFELHVAIQSVFDWADSHLHAFRITQNKKGVSARDAVTTIALPSSVIDGWEEDFKDKDEQEELLADWFESKVTQCVYEYDFGDTWLHAVKLERTVKKDKDIIYPQCLGGKNACPPDDCGGVPGYEHLKHVLEDPKHPEYQEMQEWLDFVGVNEFRPDYFDFKEVVFRNPQEELRKWGEE